MEDFQKILPITKAKRDLLDIIKQMEEEDETIAITEEEVLEYISKKNHPSLEMPSLF